MDTTFGEFIRHSRDKKDLSLREMADKLDCSAAFLSDIELSKRYPSDKMLEKIAVVLSLKMSELEKYDTRSAVNQFKKVAPHDPVMAFAFRKAIDKKIDSAAIMKFIDKQAGNK